MIFRGRLDFDHFRSLYFVSVPRPGCNLPGALDARLAKLLEGVDALLLVLRAEYRSGPLVLRDAERVLNLVPRLEHSVLRRAPHMPLLLALLEVALDAASVQPLAEAAFQLKALRVHCAANSLVPFRSEPDFGGPVDADHMGPLVVSDRLENALEVGTEHAREVSAFQLVAEHFLTPSAEPGLVWQGQAVKDFSAVAGLVRRRIAKLANDNLVVFVVVVLKADVADDQIVSGVLEDLDLEVRVNDG